jgi:hypothetical protein
MIRVLSSLLILVLCLHALRADPDEEPEAVEPPIVHRPANFSGAIGSHLEVTMRAEPRTLQAEDPLTLTVAIKGTGSLEKLPRPDLRQLPDFAKRFQIDNGGDRYLPREQTREFDYRLKPRSTGVRQIPPLPFVYFKPGVIPDYMGYQTALAPAILLTVKPRGVVAANEIQGDRPPLSLPDAVYQLTEGAAVLRAESPLAFPSPWLLAGLLLAPPVLCLVWYSAWRRAYPDAARVARQKRSRAAQHALKALGGLSKLTDEQQAYRAEAVLAEYLRERLDIAVALQPPVQVAAQLSQAGFATSLVREIAEFFAACTAARFAPGLQTDRTDWTGRSTRLLLALEAESWRLSVS